MVPVVQGDPQAVRNVGLEMHMGGEVASTTDKPSYGCGSAGAPGEDPTAMTK